MKKKIFLIYFICLSIFFAFSDEKKLIAEYKSPNYMCLNVFGGEERIIEIIISSKGTGDFGCFYIENSLLADSGAEKLLKKIWLETYDDSDYLTGKEMCNYMNLCVKEFFSGRLINIGAFRLFDIKDLDAGSKAYYYTLKLPDPL